MAGKSAFQEDLARYPGPMRWSDPALWSIAVYRLGRRIVAIGSRPVRRLLLCLVVPCAKALETLTKTSLPVFAETGGGLRIVSCRMIFIHKNTVIGRNCMFRCGVTIGNAREDSPTPIIGDNVDIGAYAQILGGVRIGDDAKIATMSVVIEDVSAEGVASGIPAKFRAGEQPGASSATILTREQYRKGRRRPILERV